MSIDLMGVIFQSGALFDPVDSLLLLRLAFRINDRKDREHCFCLIGDLAQSCRRSPRQVERILKRLEGDGWLRVSRRAGGRGKAPDFWVNRGRLEAAAGMQNSDTHDVADSMPQNNDMHDVGDSSLDRHNIGDSIPRHFAAETTTSGVKTSTFDAENHDTQMSPHSKYQKEKPKEITFTHTNTRAIDIFLVYPRRVGKAKAIEAIDQAASRLVQDGDCPDQDAAMDFLLAKATEYARSPAGEKPSGCDTDFRPHPATWFSGERYLDDPAEWGQCNGERSGTNYPDDDRQAWPRDWRERSFADDEVESRPVTEGELVAAPAARTARENPQSSGENADEVWL